MTGGNSRGTPTWSLVSKSQHPSQRQRQRQVNGSSRLTSSLRVARYVASSETSAKRCVDQRAFVVVCHAVLVGLTMSERTGVTKAKTLTGRTRPVDGLSGRALPRCHVPPA